MASLLSPKPSHECGTEAPPEVDAGGGERERLSTCKQIHMHDDVVHTFVVANRPPSVKALVTVTSTASDSVERGGRRRRSLKRNILQLAGSISAQNIGIHDIITTQLHL